MKQTNRMGRAFVFWALLISDLQQAKLVGMYVCVEGLWGGVGMYLVYSCGACDEPIATFIRDRSMQMTNFLIHVEKLCFVSSDRMTPSAALASVTRLFLPHNDI